MNKHLIKEAEALEEQFASKESQFFDTVCAVDDNAEIQTLRRLCRTMPDNFEVHIVLSDCLRLQKRYTEGGVVMDRALDMAPLSPVGYRRRAKLAQCCLQLDRARADFDYSRELDSEQPDIAFDLGVSEFMLAHYAEAKICLDEALGLAEDPEQRIITRYWNVLACSKLGDTVAIDALLADFEECEAEESYLAYYHALRLFSGNYELNTMLQVVSNESDDVDYVTEMYAICIWLEANLRWGEAAELRQKLLLRDHDWDCLAYLAAAADAEWHRLRESTNK